MVVQATESDQVVSKTGGEGEGKGSLTGEIMALLGKLSERFEPEDGEMKDWIIEHFHNPIIVELLQDTTFLMMRVLDAIGQLEPVNGITISKHHQIPKGSVSKTTRRLIAKNLIAQEALPNNKKEILFRLTETGRELYLAHRAFDQQMEKGFIRFLQRYTETELQFLTRVLQDATEVSFLRLEE
ncbi:MAG TPA: MarR family transcriptional regulator [Phototrophicaceae bacterium]|jgi:DNA-binding MarR family transcriptional regulator|nr:MarR family transcriptional regulator [Phototrophicaceae bacterium]